MTISKADYSVKKGIRAAFLLALCLLLIPLSVFALSLDEAKAKGMVGEEPSGYLGAVVSSPEVNQLIQDINSKRRVKYQQIAAQNQTPVAAVEALAGQKAMESTPAGQYIKSSGGSWTKK